MLWPRRTCAFGLPDEDEDAAIGDIVSVAIGHVLRVTAADIVDAPLPGRLIALLRQLERREQSTGSEPDCIAQARHLPPGCHDASPSTCRSMHLQSEMWWGP